MSSSKQFEAKGGATLSRRTLVGAVGVTAATLAAGKAFAQASPGPVAPPSTITQPPRDFSRNGAPTTYFTDPDILSVDPSFNALAPAQQRHPATVDRRAVVGRTGVERAGTLSGVERHSQQPATALARGRRAGERLPQPVEQQQRQHLRLPGPPAVLRAPDAPRGALRARRLGDRARRRLRRQEAELAQRRRAPSRRQLLVHRSALRRPALRRRARCRGRSEQSQRQAQSQARPGGGHRPRQARAADQLLPHRSQRQGRSRGHRGPGAGSQRSLLLARLQEALCREHRQGTGRHRSGRQGRDLFLRCRNGQQGLQPASCSPTAWSTA